MKILVVGRGWVGKKMVNELISRDYIVTTSCSHQSAIREIENSSYECVINCAGITGSPNVDACESYKVETIEANVAFPVKLYQACTNPKAYESHRIQFVHFSSGCIYQGEIDDVNADPNYFGSIYSVSKGVSDLYLKNKPRSLVFRIRMPFTGVDEPKNYLSKVMNYARTGKLVDFGQNSLTDLDEAVKVAVDLIEEGASGPVNLVNSGSIDMHELADMLAITPEWYTEKEFAKVAVAGRSTCTIPAHKYMSPVRDALQNAILKVRK